MKILPLCSCFMWRIACNAYYCCVALAFGHSCLTAICRLHVQVEVLAKQVLQSPIEIQVGGRSVVNSDISQFVEIRPEEDRFLRLLEILGEWYERGKILIFVSSQDQCDNLFRDLIKVCGRNFSLGIIFFWLSHHCASLCWIFLTWNTTHACIPELASANLVARSVRQYWLLRHTRGVLACTLVLWGFWRKGLCLCAMWPARMGQHLTVSMRGFRASMRLLPASSQVLLRCGWQSRRYLCQKWSFLARDPESA